jgi:hypothetical protein
MKTLIFEFPWCDQYNIDSIKVDIHNKSFTINDSYKIKRGKHMKEVLKRVNNYANVNLSIHYQVCEWKTHNLLYACKYQVERTKHCDINEDVTFLEKIGFVVASLFYFGY